MANIKWNNWRDRLKDASFRGVPFYVLSTTHEGGRRAVIHQFPFSDEPYWEDMGAEAGTYNIVGYVIANTANSFDHFQARDALVEALRKEGPGTLVHPFYGSLNVGIQGKYKLDEAFTEGGVARFTMTFVDAGRAVQPSGLIDSEGIADEACDAALDTVEEQLAGTVVTTGPGLFAQAQQLAAKAQAAVAKIQNTLTTIQATVVSVISTVQTTVAELSQTIQSIIDFPSQFATAIKNMLSVYDNLIPHMPDKNTSNVDAALGLITFGDDFVAVAETTESREQELINQNALIDAVRCGGIIAAVRAAAYANYGSVENAASMLAKLIAAIDTVMNSIGANSQNDVLYELLRELKAIITRIMIDKGANLPATKTLMLPQDPQPTLVLAQSLYGDITREQEIQDMNPIETRHPGFPLGGNELRVLSE